MPGARVLIFGWAPSVHIKRWSRGLSERGYNVKVVSLGGKPLDGVETVILPRSSKWSYIRHSARAAEETREFRPDLLHVHYVTGFGLWAMRAGFHPTVVSVWGSDVMDRPSNPLIGFFTKRALRYADYVTATSDVLKRSTLDLVPSLIGRIETIPFGVNLPDELMEPPSESPLKICWVKQLFRKYGPDVLLKAVKLVKEKIPDIQVNLAGDGDMEEQLKQMIKDFDLSDNVRLLGWMSNKDIYSFIQQHHFLVMPSLKEAFGVAVLEASACGRPAIASDVGGVSEVLVDGQTGILVPKGDADKLAEAILKLANDVDLRTKMGAAGRVFVRENYTWDKSLDMMEELYERLLREQK